MFFGTGGKVVFLSDDWTHVIVELKLGIWSRNFIGTIFGGSQFAAADPFHMVPLIHILGSEFVVWDKSGNIVFKKPGKGKLRAEFRFTPDEIESIKTKARHDGSYLLTKSVPWIDEQGDTVSVVEKTLYVATKEHHQKRQLEREKAKN